MKKVTRAYCYYTIVYLSSLAITPCLRNHRLAHRTPSGYKKLMQTSVATGHKLNNKYSALPRDNIKRGLARAIISQFKKILLKKYFSYKVKVIIKNKTKIKLKLNWEESKINIKVKNKVNIKINIKINIKVKIRIKIKVKIKVKIRVKV
ncbi:hypothetical protein B0H67DRAFT_549911 [Lasiosphaeris hirsuta]|uniref:Uncharacterized protein n=1 Tax=Lasiosphaeris hirsuta TaxID=260670 RepID=A0AA40BDN3_9PEZI|nr:hypothetical protein B0H67DRAFT_549911 [Lasiosphaeris hirsuta]